MIIIDNDGLLQGPADPKCIDIHSPAEMRHWAREIGQSAGKLNKAVKAVGPLALTLRKTAMTRTKRSTLTFRRGFAIATPPFPVGVCFWKGQRRDLSLAFSDDEIGLVEIVEVDPDQGDRVIG